jgi:Ca-activated chloride channel homolog
VNKFFPVFLFALFNSALIPQDANALSPPVPTWKPPAPTIIWRPPVLVIPNRDVTPIQLQTIRVSSDVNGRHAATEIDMTFFNPNGRVLEGELQFPLLDGQRVASFAMDVNGALREAVPVEKAKGQAVFEDVIRTRIDPGLLEVTQGNNFKLRVYPIPAQGAKRVVIRIAENLTDISGETIYRLPIGFAERVGMLEINVAINVNADATDKAPAIRRNGFGAVNLSKDLLRNTYRVRESRRDFSISDSSSATIEFAIPASTAPAVQTQIFEGKTYFVADVSIPSRESVREVSRNVGIIWDSSGSGRERDHAREFQLLDTYFKKMRDGEVRLTQIRNVAEPVQTFRISNGDWKALRDVLSSTAYDGATNLNAFVPESSVREYLLFSDGLNNFTDGADKNGFAKTRVPLYSISASNKIDATFLKFIAERSGGRFIDLTRETSASAATALLSAVTRITQIDGTGISQLVLAATHAIGGRVQIAGMLNDASATLRIALQHPDSRQETIDVPIQRTAKDDDNLGTAASLWAELRINELDAEYQLNRAEIRRLGQRFRLVTRETSLIILDRIEDYARFEIAPPSELRADYDRVLGNIQTQRRTERGSHLENIVRMFEAKIAWWNHSFPKNDRYVENKMKKSEERERGALFEGDVARVDAASQDRAPMKVQAVPAPPVAAAPAVEAPASRRSMMATAAQPVSVSAEKRVTQTTSTIRLQKWEPNAPYADRLKRASSADLYRVYLDEAPGYLASTAFYLDAADIFFERGLNDLGIRVLSNLAEMDLENRHILRILGYRLMQANHSSLAIPVFKRVLELSPEEPQSYRDLGLAYAADKQPQRAIDSLYDVVTRPWHGRFPEVELIALAELNSIIATTNAKLDTSRIDTRLIKNLPLDLRAVLTWDADNTDIDLWVTDPNGEKASYSNRMTYQGGRMSLDFTGGYGPEEFSLKVAKPGKYRVQAQYFGDRRQNVTGATTLQMRLTTGFGTKQQRDQIVTMRLKDGKETIMVGEFEIK